MKSIKKSIRITAVSVISLFIISCDSTTNNESEYYNLIPANSFYVASVDVDKLKDDAAITSEQLAIITKDMKDIGVISQNIDKYDSSEPVYAFMTNDLIFGVVAKIKNTEEFIPTFDLLKKEMNLNSDTTVVDYSLAYNDRIAIVYKGTSFIIIAKDDKFATMFGGTNPTSTLTPEKYIKAIMSGEKESITSTDAFKKLQTENSDMGFMQIMDQNYPLMKFPINFITTNYIDFEKGKVIMNTIIDLEANEITKALEKYYAKTSGKFDEYIPSNYIMYANGAVSNDGDSKELLDLTKQITDLYFEEIEKAAANLQNKPSTQEVNRALMASKKVVDEVLLNIMSSFNGECVFTINTLPMMPEIVFMADVKNNDILNNLISYIPAPMVTRKSENQYVVNASIVNIEVGIKDNVFYITNSPTTFKAFNEGVALDNNFKSTPFAKKAKGLYGGLDLRIDNLMSSPAMGLAVAQMGKQEIPILPEIENIEMISKTPTSAETTINMKNKENNALNTIAVEVIELLPAIQ